MMGQGGNLPLMKGKKKFTTDASALLPGFKLISIHPSSSPFD
jgi:hypothetical protein